MEATALSTELLDLVLTQRKRARLRITGTSMEPLLRAGMVVEVEPFVRPPRVGDILIFRSQRGLIAHRLIRGERFSFRAAGRVVAERVFDQRSATFITCGDNFPDRTELVPGNQVFGRVSAVWDDADPGARRVDGRLFRVRGVVRARTRLVRSGLAKLRAAWHIMRADPAGVAPPATFSVLVAATAAFEQGRAREGLDLLCSVPARPLIDMIRRHHMSGVALGWLADASRAGVNAPQALHAPLLRLRLANALQATRILACAREIHAVFTAAAIPHVFLKGAARLGAGLRDADRQYAGDVDVLVPDACIDTAMRTLREAGYDDVRPKDRQRAYASMHHREPLRSPATGIPVEVHSTLIRPDVVDQPLRYRDLASRLQTVRGPIGHISVLDDVGAAVHLAYHARDLSVLRDLVLLARLLAGFDAASRTAFDVWIGREGRDRRRLRSAVALAEWIGGSKPVRGPNKRYVDWAVFREDLPATIHADILEALLGQCVVPKLRSRHDLPMLGRIYLRNMLALPFIGRLARWRRRAPQRRWAAVGCAASK